MKIDYRIVLALVALTNLIAFAAQGIDKWRARAGSRRIPEARLLGWGVPFAAPGMWLGMRVFHHKTSKPSFLVLAWMVTLVNLLLIAAAAWCAGRGWLEIGSFASQ